MTKPNRNLTEEEIQRYEEDGVIQVSGLFDHSWVDMIRTGCEQNLEDPSPFVREAVKEGEQGRFQTDIWTCLHKPQFWDYVFKSPAAEIAAQAMRTDTVYFFYDQPFIKLPNTPAPTAWHNDLPFWPFAEPKGLVSIWMAANDFSADDSGLEFVRGSHKWNKWYLAISADNDPALMQTDLPPCPNFSELRDEYDVVSWDMKAGDVMIFNSLVVHGATGNPSATTPRIAHSTRWLSPEAVWENRPATAGAFMPNVADLPNNRPIDDEIFRERLPLVWKAGEEVEILSSWQRPAPVR